MKYLILALLLIFPTNLIAADYHFLYQVKGNCTPLDKTTMEHRMDEGWKILNDLTNHRLGVADFKITEKNPNIIFDIDHIHPAYQDQTGKLYYTVHPAEAEKGIVTVFWKYFCKYDATNQARIIAHELGHTIFNLLDQYQDWKHPWIKEEQPGCLMGYNYKQWDGHFCNHCQEKVDKYYERLRKARSISVAESVRTTK